MKSAIVKMSPTTRLLLAIVLCALAAAGLYMQGILPQQEALRAEKDKNKRLKPDVELKQLKLDKIKTQVREPVPISPERRKALVDNGTALFDAGSRQAFLEELPKIAKAAALQDFTLKDVSKMEPADVIVSLPGDETHELSKVVKVPAAMRFRGTFSGLNNFLTRISDRGGYVRLGALKLRPIRNTENLYADLMIYIYSEEGG